MIDLLANKTVSGDLYITLAEQLLFKDEWGLAMLALERGLNKGKLTFPEKAYRLRHEIDQRISGGV